MNHQQWIRHITGGGLDGTLLRLYPAEQLSAQRRRYCGVIDQFTALYPSPADRDIWLFSAPGRVELGGNHTDHNHGRVLAAAIDLDIIAAAAVNDAQTNGHPVIRVTSDSYPQNVVTLDSLDPRPAERGRSAGMIRGVAAGFTAAGCPPADFDTYTTATVLKGSGLSSSAAFEVLIGTMLNQLFAGGAVPPLTVARIAQRAENEYFGKPSGLMDQAASAIGAAVMLDFADPKTPAAAPLSIDFAAHGFALCVVDTGGSHADLTAEYAAIPAEMRGVAAALGHTVLRECDPAAFYTALPQLRRSCGDRAVLRAANFFAENRRVAEQAACLRNGDIAGFIRHMIDSGRSSYELLQNAYPLSKPREQGLSLALLLAEQLLCGAGGWRLHGGGFGGTTLNLVPFDRLERFRLAMENLFGTGCCHVLKLRPVGGIRVASDEWRVIAK